MFPGRQAQNAVKKPPHGIFSQVILRLADIEIRKESVPDVLRRSWPEFFPSPIEFSADRPRNLSGILVNQWKLAFFA
jgi:hypothetical protein